MLDTGGFEVPTGSQPWVKRRHWKDTYFRYVVCEKRRP